MFVANPTDPSFPTIRYLSALGPNSPYPRADAYPFDGTASASRTRRAQRGQLSTIAGIVLAAAAFSAGFLGGFTAAETDTAVAPVAHRPMPGEFLLGPGNMTPPGIVVPLE